MKLITALLALGFTGAVSATTITGTSILSCRGGMGEATGTLTLIDTDQGFVAEASAAWLGGTYGSGQVPVTVDFKDDNSMVIENAAVGFLVNVVQEGRSADGKAIDAALSGSFKDERTGRKASLVPQMYRCL